MLHYHFECKIPTSQFIQITLNIQPTVSGELTVQFPAWRAGRYQLANYAENIRGFHIVDDHGKSVATRKISKDAWVFKAENQGSYHVQYEYFAGKMDAGSAWVDDRQVYVNFVNCCPEVKEMPHSPISLSYSLPQWPESICTLKRTENHTYLARDYQDVVDSTLLAAKHLTNWNYQVEGINFTIWIHGEIHFEQAQFISLFRKFTQTLLRDFGEFPEKEYHFIFQLLPYKHYHGVEHRRGTVITFGPTESLAQPGAMEELLGVSCHELYHAWNVCRIRPQELLPYDFSKENYTQVGLILEGITTYMGDLYLLKSGVYDFPTYLRHAEKTINRETDHFGWKNHTILESSFDLWLDGYVPGIPDRKVNIYTRGSLLAWCMDILLLKQGSALAVVMKKMWEQFGKPLLGYSMEDFESIVTHEFADPSEIKSFFLNYVHGYEDLFPYLTLLLTDIGIEISDVYGADILLHQCGIRTSPERIITQIHPGSKAFRLLMRNDRIINHIIQEEVAQLEIQRQGREMSLTVPLEENFYFPSKRLSYSTPAPLTMAWMD